jgi:hypothetical protein
MERVTSELLKASVQVLSNVDLLHCGHLNDKN